MDSDDLWLPEKLEKQIAFMTNHGYHFSYTNYVEIDEESVPNGKRVTGPKKITKAGMFNYCWPGCLTVMYDAEFVGLIQIEEIKKNNDYAMWLKVCRKADCYLLDESLARYRKRRGSISNHSYMKLIKWHYKLYREAEKRDVIVSAVLTIINLFWGGWKKFRYVKGCFVLAKTSVLGHFGAGETLLNGQTVKTKIITEELRRRLGREQVLKIDTHGGWKTLAKAPAQTIFALKNSRNVLIFPAQNGLRIYAPLLSFFRHFFKGRKLHYVVIGGWLPQFLAKRRRLTNALKKFDGIYVETATMKSALEAQGFENALVMPNCKKLTVLSEKELVYPQGVPYKLCTFSRVMKEKGIETAIHVIKKVNEQLGYLAYSLDIYGQVDTTQTEWFENLKKYFPEGVRYCGCVDADKSVEILQSYFALLFPTHFCTEGIPGTIIDAYAAGVPVISAKWESYTDVVDEGMTGIGYEFDNDNEFENVLLSIAHEPKMLLDMKANCTKKAKDYMPETVIQIITEKIVDA